MYDFTAEQIRTLEHAVPAARALVRLQNIRDEGHELTFNQDTDRQDAMRAWDNARAILPELGEWGKWETTEDLHKAVRILEGFAKQGDAVRARDGLASLGLDRLSSGSGLEGPRSRDQIRDMLTSNERQHDFDFPETDAIRALPYEDGDNTRAISNFANSSSLYVSEFASRVAVYARTLSPWLGLATVSTSDNGRPLVVPMLTGDPTVYTPGEGTAITASDVTLSSVTVSPLGYKALMYISAEAFEDEDVDLTNLIARAQARAISLAYGTAFTATVLAGINNGGTAVPTGGAGTGTPTFVGYEDLIDLEYGRAAPYRESASWIFANGMIKKARKYKDQNGNYLWSPSLVTGQPPSFEGHSLFEDPALAAPASATKSAIFGDIGAALMAKATPIRVAVSSDFKFDTDQIAIKTVQRIALAVQDPAAAAFLVSANA